MRFARAPAALRATGLLGWATATLNGEVDIGYIAVRRTLDRRIVLAFSERQDSDGRGHPVVRPLDQAARKRWTEQIVDELRRMKVLP